MIDRDDAGAWLVGAHADVVHVLDHPATFSNVVSRHVAVPNGMDPPEHTAFRAVVDRYFTPSRLADVEPALRQISADLVAALPRGRTVEVMEWFAEPFAARAQCAFMGWPASLHEPLRQWVKRNHAATRARDRAAMADVASAFDGHIRAQLDARRDGTGGTPQDATSRLLGDTVGDRPLTDDEIVSIVRNWTVGELATIAAGIGIIAHFLATHPAVQEQLRRDATDLESAADEILRLHAPLLTNRRRTTESVTLGGCTMAAGDPVLILWAQANRDEHAFDEATEFRRNREPSNNLLYGRGLHVCPGAPLARMEFRVVLEELFRGTAHIAPDPDRAAEPASAPTAGFATLPLMFSSRT
ncbi:MULTISPECIES: cytochrome P450 [Mycolicibacterium]|uniref:Cytochrome P450 n=3 Tax=Mycolicibacterium gilvum TaxID=1804 RepID=E6TE81_MYCSR|nr:MULTISPECIES: cytochrome P450 [Mycolicibacterium]ABP47482.1 cytochrome P450 [Mycolicibacterium gilvum PYR-GCK]ADU00990.1 cytochrome P450 [Mycolicibacterium gilvum Spyr1]MBV5242542.1 cytochrome P450 [Mycolicibacterium sp. PAM1]MCV7058642.1 cytochrome P450 [Mycolicibacterium gilvum]STZ41990.1 cytochrome P450 [Mycolicibacterium gilvum]